MENQERESAGIISMSSLLRSMGSLTSTSGRGLLMFRCLAVSSTSAAIMGLCGAYIGGFLTLGGGHFFVIGSCIGYVSSCFYFYHNEIKKAFAAFDEYPELMRLHMVKNFPLMQFQRMNMRPGHRERERARIGSSWYLTSMLVSAYQTASPSIDDIHFRKEQILITEMMEEAEAEKGEEEAS